MRIPALVLMFVVVALAGCFGAGADGQASKSERPAASTSAASTPVPQALVAVTDTLRLRSDLTLTTSNATKSEPDQTASPYQGPGLLPQQGSDLVWTYRLTGGNLTLGAYEARIWVRVVETLAGPPEGPICSWSLTVEFFRNPRNDDGSSNSIYPIACSGPTGPTVAPGDYELRFSAEEPLMGASYGFGQEIEVRLNRDALGPSAESSAFVLTGSADFDSRITFTGAAEPVAKA